MAKMKTVDLALCALFAAISALLSQIVIPVGVIPVNFTHLSIFLSAGILGAKNAAVSQTVFVAMGAVGVPVFAGFSGGFGVLLGPKGGFIISYIACAFITGIIIQRFGKSITVIVFAMLCGMVTTYILGIFWFMYITGTPFLSAIMICVVPFLVGDAIKIGLSTAIIKRININKTCNSI